MERLRVWTKQHQDVWKVLEEEGRYISKKEYIVQKMEDISGLYLEAYTWYSSRAAAIVPRPPDVKFPIWVSLGEAPVLGNDPGTLMLELEVPKDRLVAVDYDKWGYAINLLYLPAGPADEAEHEKMLKSYGVDDIEAYTSPFYPMIKKKIIKSWDAVFVTDRQAQDSAQVGTLWEIRKEWVKQVIR